MVVQFISVQAASLDANDIPTTQDFTVSGGPGSDPIAAVVTVTRAETDDTITAEGTLGVAFWADTPSNLGNGEDEGVATHGADGETTGNPSSGGHTARSLVAIADGTVTTTQLEATLTPVTDGIRLNYNTKPAAGVNLLVRVDCWFGIDNAYVGTFNANNATGGPPESESITDPGFQPQALIMASDIRTTANIVSRWRHGIGFAATSDDGTTITQAAMGSVVRDTTIPVVAGQKVNSTRGFAQVTFLSTTFIDTSIEITSFDATGFTYEIDEGAIARHNFVIYYLAIRFEDAGKAWAGAIATDTTAATFTQNITDPMISPIGGLIVPTWVITANSRTEGADAISAGLSSFSTTQEFSSSVTCHDGVSTTAAKSYTKNDEGFHFLDADGTKGIEGTIATTGTGIDATLTTNDTGDSHQFLLFLFGTEPEAFVDETIEITESIHAVLGELKAIDEAIDITEDRQSLVAAALFDTEVGSGRARSVALSGAVKQVAARAGAVAMHVSQSA